MTGRGLARGAAVLLALLSVPGCRQKPGPAAAAPDIWGPWRKEARAAAEAYQVGPAPARVFPLATPAATASFPGASVALPFQAGLSEFPLSETEGVELSFRFRLGRVPPGRLEASQGLAQFRLNGASGNRGFCLHAYSGSSALCLNGILSGGPRQEILLSRGASAPQSGPRWDTRWHTVRLAWCRGQLAASWDGFPILHVADPSIDYGSFTLEWVKPEVHFGTLELSPFEARAAHFSSRRPK